MSNEFKLTGLLGGDAELRFTPSGLAVANASIADTPRKFNRDTNSWEDAGHTLWMRVSMFGQEAERFAEAGTKGSKVTVYGRVKADEWTDKATGEARRGVSMVVDAFTVHEKRQQQSQQGQQQPQSDPWGSQPQGGGFGDQDDRPPF